MRGWAQAPTPRTRRLLLIHENDILGNSLPRTYGYAKPQFVAGERGLELRNVPVRERRLWERIYARARDRGRGDRARPGLRLVMEAERYPLAASVSRSGISSSSCRALRG